MAIKPSDLSPTFIKKIEDRYGKIDMKNDFFADDLSYYAKATNVESEEDGGGVESTIIKLPSFVTLFQSLEKAKDDAKELTSNKELKGDTEYKNQYIQVRDTFNDFRTYFRNNYPDQYELATGKIQEIVKEISTTAGSPGYTTPYAFGKAPISTYTKMGYKPVNRKALRKKSKGFDYIDLYKD
tara:strand:- start:378 stop:926 length:549 start_codon:yes stop_codon:yes gene_type:complete